MAGLDPAIHRSKDSLEVMDLRASPVMTSGKGARQFNTRFKSGLSSENVGTSISKRSPLSLTIW